VAFVKESLNSGNTEFVLIGEYDSLLSKGYYSLYKKLTEEEIIV